MILMTRKKNTCPAEAKKKCVAVGPKQIILPRFLPDYAACRVTSEL